MERFLKQLVYGGLYALVLVLAGIFLYAAFLKAPASCFDKKQNQNEEGIDCGGSCGTVCLPPTLQPIQAVGGVRLLSLQQTQAGERRTSVLVEVQNTNQGLAARSFPYTITIYGPAGVVQNTISDSSYIYEREVKYIAIPNVIIAPDTIRAEIVFGAPAWTKAADFKRPNIALKEVRGVVAPEGVRAEGVIVNSDPVAVAHATLIAIFYDAQGREVAVSTTELDDIAPQESRLFSIIHPPHVLIDTSRAPRVVVEALPSE